MFICAVFESENRSKHWLWKILKDIRIELLRVNPSIRVYFVTSPPCILPDKSIYVKFNLNMKHCVSRLRKDEPTRATFMVPLHTWLVNSGLSWPIPGSIDDFEACVMVFYILSKVEEQIELGGNIRWKFKGVQLAAQKRDTLGAG